MLLLVVALPANAGLRTADASGARNATVHGAGQTMMKGS